MPGPQLRRINQLPDLTTPTTQLAGAYLAWDVPLGPVAGGYKTMRGTPEELVAYLSAQGLLSAYNAKPSLRKAVEFRTIAEKLASPAHFPDSSTMEELDPASMCLGTQIYVVTDPDEVHEYKVVYDSNGPLLVWVDGNFSQGPRGKIQAKIVPAKAGAGSQGITLVAAQALITASTVAPGDFYVLTGDWNATGTDTTVYVLGLRADAFACSGWVVDSTGGVLAVNVDVVAGTWQVDNQQQAETITYANLLAELNTNGAVRQKWFFITQRTNSQPDVTVYFTNPNDPSGWGDDAIPHVQPDGQSTRTRWAKYRLLPDAFEYDQSLGGVTPAQLAAVATSLLLRPTRTASDTLTVDDLGALAPVNASGPVTLTVAAGLGLAAPSGAASGAAKVCYPLQTGPGQLTLAAAPGVNLRPALGGGLRSPGQDARLVLIWLDTNTVLVEGGVV